MVKTLRVFLTNILVIETTGAPQYEIRTAERCRLVISREGTRLIQIYSNFLFICDLFDDAISSSDNIFSF
jgi:hypothetical protein